MWPRQSTADSPLRRLIRGLRAGHDCGRGAIRRIPRLPIAAVAVAVAVAVAGGAVDEVGVAAGSRGNSCRSRCGTHVTAASATQRPRIPARCLRTTLLSARACGSGWPVMRDRCAARARAPGTGAADSSGSAASCGARTARLCVRRRPLRACPRRRSRRPGGMRPGQAPRRCRGAAVAVMAAITVLSRPPRSRCRRSAHRAARYRPAATAAARRTSGRR